MSRRRAKSLKLDQVIDLLLDDTVSSESSDDSVSQSPKTEIKTTITSVKPIEKSPEEPPKKSSSDNDSDDDEDIPLWQLATKRKTPELPQNASPIKNNLPDTKKSDDRKSSSDNDSDDDEDMPLWQLATKKKTPELPQKNLQNKKNAFNEDTSNDEDVPLAMVAKKAEPLKSCSNHLNVENKKNEIKEHISSTIIEAKQPETILKIRNKKIASSLRGIYDFLDADSFKFKKNVFDSDMSSEEESNHNSVFFGTTDLKENCFTAGEKRMKSVAQSPVIKMDCMTNNKYYISAKNLKRRKIFNN